MLLDVLDRRIQVPLEDVNHATDTALLRHVFSF